MLFLPFPSDGTLTLSTSFPCSRQHCRSFSGTDQALRAPTWCSYTIEFFTKGWKFYSTKRKTFSEMANNPKVVTKRLLEREYLFRCSNDSEERKVEQVYLCILTFETVSYLNISFRTWFNIFLMLFRLLLVRSYLDLKKI